MDGTARAGELRNQERRYHTGRRNPLWRRNKIASAGIGKSRVDEWVWGDIIFSFTSRYDGETGCQQEK